MPHISNFLAVLEGHPTAAVPFWELEFHAWDSFSREPMRLGEAFTALSSREQENALHQNAEVMLRVSQELGFSALTVPGGYWEAAPGHPAYYWLLGEARFEQINLLRKHKPPELTLVAVTGGVMAMPGANEYVQFCYDMYDAPEKIEALAAKTLAGGIVMARRMRDLDVEAVVTASDIADNHGVFFKPPLLRRFVLPYLREWAAAARALGLYTILHSDGNLNACLDEIADSGVHALQAVDPVAGMNMGAAKARVGERLTLCGNIDCGLLLTGTAEQVYDSTKDLLQACMPGGRLVLGASNAVQPEVPAENYRAMVKAWREFGNYGLSQ